ncbi:MAG: hypothetical protein EXR07_20735 [Acetobacteraceae bacterium]|nr:hypothetical protein [Acetobacteraceae bacterium]
MAVAHSSAGYARALARPLGSAWTKIPATLVLGAPSDPRQHLVREAADCWNREFAGIGSAFRPRVLTQSATEIPANVLKGLSETMINQRSSPPFPERLRGLPGDMIVAWSKGDFVSFAMR